MCARPERRVREAINCIGYWAVAFLRETEHGCMRWDNGCALDMSILLFILLVNLLIDLQCMI